MEWGHSLAQESLLGFLGRHGDVAHATIAEGALPHQPVRGGGLQENPHACIHDGYVVLPPPSLLVTVHEFIL